MHNTIHFRTVFLLGVLSFIISFTGCEKDELDKNKPKPGEKPASSLIDFEILKVETAKSNRQKDPRFGYEKDFRIYLELLISQDGETLAKDSTAHVKGFRNYISYTKKTEPIFVDVFPETTPLMYENKSIGEISRSGIITRESDFFLDFGEGVNIAVAQVKNDSVAILVRGTATGIVESTWKELVFKNLEVTSVSTIVEKKKKYEQKSYLMEFEAIFSDESKTFFIEMPLKREVVTQIQKVVEVYSRLECSADGNAVYYYGVEILYSNGTADMDEISYKTRIGNSIPEVQYYYSPELQLDINPAECNRELRLVNEEITDNYEIFHYTRKDYLYNNGNQIILADFSYPLFKYISSTSGLLHLTEYVPQIINHTETVYSDEKSGFYMNDPSKPIIYKEVEYHYEIRIGNIQSSAVAQFVVYYFDESGNAE